MRPVAIVMFFALMFGGGFALAAAQQSPFNCEDFATQAEAQLLYDHDPERHASLDPDGSGVACAEHFGLAAETADQDDVSAGSIGTPVTDAPGDGVPATTVNVQLILDVSGSMAQALPTGESRMDAAKQVMGDVIDGLPEREGVNVGLRVYGHEGDNTQAGRPTSCQSSELVVPMAGVEKGALRSEVEQLQPTGWTPLALSLERAGEDFEPASEGTVNVAVLVTDGLETCDGNPVAVAGELRAQEIELTTHVVAFALTAEEQASVAGIAEAGGGLLLGADDAAELSDAIFSILVEDIPDIVTPTPQVVEGPIGTREVPVPMGTAWDVGRGWTLMVIDVVPNATDQVMAENMFNDPPAAGHQFVIVTVSATYEGEGSSAFFSDIQLSVVGASNVAQAPFEAFCGVIPNPFPDFTEVFTGGTITGNVCWSMPSTDVPTLVMFSDEWLSFSGGDRVWFSLQPE